MKVSLKWLGRYVEIGDLSPARVLDDLTMSTAEVEGIETFGQGLAEVVVGRVIECEKHPDADKLSVTRVDVGQGEFQSIVCGAPNVRAGQTVAVVRPGAVLPGGLRIGKAKIRGVESFGMICSEKELALSDESDGILVLDGGATEPGARFVDAFDVVDHVLEIDNKSINHRPDLWGHYGFARELAAIYGRPLAPLCAMQSFPAKGESLPIAIEDLIACPRYVGLVIDGVAVRPSPAWLRYLLLAVGQRPIDLLVDLTNFVLFDLGQPMHAFDPRTLDPRGIGVRRARPGERLGTLDGVERALVPADLLITSGDRPVALAGIMGGEGTMVAADTTRLFLESANFHAATIRRTSTRLSLRTESSTRFEKALDPTHAELGVHRYLGLLQELCPTARAAGPLADPAGWRFLPRTIRLRRARLALKLGVEIDKDRVAGILEGLAFGVTEADDGFDVSVPSFRATKDITIEDDLIEEVGRMFRYDNIPEQPLRSTDDPPRREPRLYLAREALMLAATELGCHEVQSYSFVPAKVLLACRQAELPHAVVCNPVAPETARIRRHVAPGLLAALARNQDLGLGNDVRLCEEGKGYHPEHRDEDGLPREVHELSIACVRHTGESCYGTLRAGVESLLARVGYPGELAEALPSAADLGFVHPGRTVAIRRGTALCGYVGAVHPEVCRALLLPLTAALATIDLGALAATGHSRPRYRPLSPYPSQPVDVALLCDKTARAGDVARFLRDAGPDLVQAVELFEVYEGAGLADDKKSLNFTVTLGSMDRTLTAKDEEKYLSRVRTGSASIGAELRG